MRGRLALVSITTSILCVACGEVPVERLGPPEERVVSRQWHASTQVIRTAILDAFASPRTALASPFNRMTIDELKAPRFPDGWLTGYVDPGRYLEVYTDLDPAVRADDLLVQEPTGDEYWISEYAAADGPVRFRCGFVLHFAATADDTTIEAYEVVPTVWAGERWAWSAHGVGFGRIHDLRFVEPTVQDRVRMLDVIETIVSGGTRSDR